MTPVTLAKTSPLIGIYRQYPVQLTQIDGWQIAEHFGSLVLEQRSLQEGAVLADWSHVGKISLSGKQAAAVVEGMVTGAEAIAPLHSISLTDRAALRLTANDYLLLCQPGVAESLLPQIDPALVTAINQTGAMGCFALGGPRRDEVLERSTAMNLRRDRVVAGAVVQTTLHTIRCTLYRTTNLDILVHPRSLSESLFQALLDVGIGVGLTPTGVATVPVNW